MVYISLPGTLGGRVNVVYMPPWDPRRGVYTSLYASQGTLVGVHLPIYASLVHPSRYTLPVHPLYMPCSCPPSRVHARAGVTDVQV